MNRQKLVSIVTPCFNAEKHLSAYFDSVFSQTYKTIELILVNDGSSDHTEDVVRSFAPILKDAGIKFEFVSYPENRGQAYALNCGLKYVTGEYLSWIDVDDQMTEDCLEKKVSFLENNPQCDYCVCNYVSINTSSNEDVLHKPKVKYDKKAITESIVFSRDGYFMPGAYMVRCAFFDSVVTDREIFTGRGGQNAQMLIPCSWYGSPGYIDEVLYKYYFFSDSHSHSIDEPRKHVQQLYDFQEIVINTIKRTNDAELMKYIPDVEKRFARLRFGHSLDSKDKALIKQCAKQLKDLGLLTNHDRYLVFRYTNTLSRIIFPV
ncbi:MAG: glycosyltransferase family 2 protein [Solobacterium sp.]|nr:glycosyltransferase family 2 protein [Solobacterium sp.]